MKTQADGKIKRVLVHPVPCFLCVISFLSVFLPKNTISGLFEKLNEMFSEYCAEAELFI